MKNKVERRYVLPLTAEQINEIRQVGLYAWAANQRPPLEPYDVLSALCDMALEAE